MMSNILNDLDRALLKDIRNFANLERRSGEAPKEYLARRWKACSSAGSFGKSNADNHLCQLIAARRQPYALIRHYVGRLGSWRRAATFIAQNARTYSSRLQEATVLCVPYSPSAPRQASTSTGASDLKGLLARVLPTHLIASAMDSLEGIAPHFQAYKEERIRSQIHAEIAIAQLFSRQDLQFVAADRYIGCSKKSCYACSLYLQHHRDDFAARPTHGNVYRVWALPRHEDSGKISDEDMATLCRMTYRIQQDIQAHLLGHLGQKQRLNSTTGMTWQAWEDKA